MSHATDTATTAGTPGAGPALRHPREVIREEMSMQLLVLRTLDDGPRTVPAIAERLGRPAAEVVFWVMGMRRFGLLTEDGDADEDGYFAYTATARGRQRGGRS